MAVCKFFVCSLVFKQWLHTFYFELHLDTAGQVCDQLIQRKHHILFCIHSCAYSSKQMRMVRSNDLLVSQIECTDKGIAKFRKEMQRSAEECYISADRFAARETTDGLVHHCLENGSR